LFKDPLEQEAPQVTPKQGGAVDQEEQQEQEHFHLEGVCMVAVEIIVVRE
jgi:hypothetical protein